MKRLFIILYFSSSVINLFSMENNQIFRLSNQELNIEFADSKSNNTSLVGRISKELLAQSGLCQPMIIDENFNTKKPFFIDQPTKQWPLIVALLKLNHNLLKKFHSKSFKNMQKQKNTFQTLLNILEQKNMLQTWLNRQTTITAYLWNQNITPQPIKKISYKIKNQDFVLCNIVNLADYFNINHVCKIAFQLVSDKCLQNHKFPYGLNQLHQSILRQKIIKQLVDIPSFINTLFKDNVKKISGHKCCVTSIAFSSDSQWLASTSDDHIIKLWNIVDFNNIYCTATLTGHTSSINSVLFSLDGKKLTSIDQSKIIKRWDITNPIAPNCISSTIDNNWTHPFTFGVNGEWGASVSYNGVMVWNINNNPINYIFTLGNDISFKSIAFSPNGNYLAAGSYNAVIKLWDISVLNALKECSLAQALLIKGIFKGNIKINNQPLKICQHYNTFLDTYNSLAPQLKKLFSFCTRCSLCNNKHLKLRPIDKFDKLVNKLWQCNTQATFPDKTPLVYGSNRNISFMQKTDIHIEKEPENIPEFKNPSFLKRNSFFSTLLKYKILGLALPILGYWIYKCVNH